MNKILILGCTGMLGHVLLHELSRKQTLEVYGTARGTNGSFKKKFNMYGEIDANRIDNIRDLINTIKPDVVINAIGIVKQLPEASDPLISIRINALFPHEIADICKAVNARMIHVSTDCVFSGKKGNYVEDDFADANDLYGRSKYLGEVKYPHCVTLRTSIIGHELRGKIGLVEWFLSQEDRVKGYTNAIYSGFPTIELARIISDIAIPHRDLNGLYHVSSYPISKFALLTLVAKIYGKKIEIEPFDEVKDDKSLNSSFFKGLTGYVSPDWETLVKEMYKGYTENTGYYQPF